MTLDEPIRVLVVDDSAFARKVLRDVLRGRHGIEVVGTASDGLEALEKMAELRPDVVTLDLVMPGLDGLGVLRNLPPEGPRVLVVSISNPDSERGIAALEAGAVDLVQKPTALATDRLYELADELIAKIRAAAVARPRPVREAPSRAVEALPATAAAADVVVIGTSTGGPQALTHLLAALPAGLPAAVAIALHIPPGYTEALARRLDVASALEVVEAAEGTELVPGRAVLAAAGRHLRLRRHGDRVFARLDAAPLSTPHRPSVDVLFESAAQTYGGRVLGVVLTGMGDDGLVGARAILAAGGQVVTEAESSCVVYGMPRVVREAGLATAEAPLPDLAALLVALLARTA